MPTAIELAERHDYQKLFIAHLHWQAPDHPPVTITDQAGKTWTATNVSSYAGIRVWACPHRPGSKTEAEIDRALAKVSTDRIVIFHSETDQVWRWPMRRASGGSAGTIAPRLTSHRHRTGQPNPKFENRLATITLPTDRILDANTVVGKIRAAFDVESQNETRHASKLMARMYAAIEASYPRSTSRQRRDHEISVVLARILFLMFGDDTAMWEPDAFRNFIYDSHTQSGATTDTGAQLCRLFASVATDDEPARTARPAGLRYINGGIFAEPIDLPPQGDELRQVLLEACRVDWSTISPAIFGSMFQSVRDATVRRQLGEHYTSETNILKTLNPLFLDDLRADLAAALQRDTRQKQVNALNDLWRQLGDIRFLDPACGCGNFIIVAYRELRDIELQVMEALLDRTLDRRHRHPTPSTPAEPAQSTQMVLDSSLVKNLRVTLDHFYGIEIDEWPARIAETAMYLVDRQCDLRLRERFGEAPERLPIQTHTTIVSEVSALNYDWSELIEPAENVVIAGNPPFLGISLRSQVQTAELAAVWGAAYHGTLDYVTGWYAKAMSYFGTIPGRWAFVSTNSIVQGEAVAPLFDQIYAHGWQISFAHRTFRWTSEATGGAAVHCVIIGFTNQPGRTPPRLFDYTHLQAQPQEVTPDLGADDPASSQRKPRRASMKSSDHRTITPYLTHGAPTIVRPASNPLNPQMGQVAYGNKPTDGGYLIVEKAEVAEFRRDPVTARYLRPFVGARELIHGEERYCLWLTDLAPGDQQRSPLLKARVAGVRRFRRDSKAASTREAARTAHLFRQISQPETEYLCIPRHVSEVRPYFLSAHFAPRVICSDANFLAADPDGLMFAIISSSAFIAWQKAVGGRLKSDLRFNKLLTWNAFPLPHLTQEDRAVLIHAGHQVLTARQAQTGCSLADMYTAGMIAPTLQQAHDELDRALDAMMGFPSGPTLLQRQAVLFERYRQFTA